MLSLAAAVSAPLRTRSANATPGPQCAIIATILRDRPKFPKDNGVWIATAQEHHESLRAEFPNMRSVGLLGKKITGWQVLGVDMPDFEEAVLRACELVVKGDARIGKVPKGKGASRRTKEIRK